MDGIQVDKVSPTLMMGEYMLRFENELELDDFYKKKAFGELGETEEIREKRLEELKQLIRGNAELSIPLEGTDLFFLSYLRACHFYTKSAYERIKMMAKSKMKHPKYFRNLVPENEKTVFQSNMLSVIPLRDQHGRRTLILQAGEKWKTKDCSLVNIIRGILLLLEAALLEPKTQIAGTNIILDFEGLSLQHVCQVSPVFAKIVLDWYQESIAVRVKAIHVVNQPFVFNMGFAIFKPFMREKMRSRIFMHGTDRNSLLNFIDAKSLPSHYGGLMDMPLDKGLDLWEMLLVYGDEYERTSKFGFKSMTEDTIKANE